jgi:hypothetical protein
MRRLLTWLPAVAERLEFPLWERGCGSDPAQSWALGQA